MFRQVDDLLLEVRSRSARGERSLATVLTREGAERLASFLSSHGVRAAHMHAGTKSLDRVRLLGELKDGSLDVLVGANLTSLN